MLQRQTRAASIPIREQLLHNNGLYANVGYADVINGMRSYQIRRLTWFDDKRHSGYQRLRATVFVDQLAWNIPVDDEGRERDHYDMLIAPKISMHCIYTSQPDQENIPLGGVRIFELNSWLDSMTFNEFYQAGMIPQVVLNHLEAHYQADSVLGLTRFCIRRGNAYHDLDSSAIRDYVYATVYSVVELTHRRHALAIVDRIFYLALRRSKFVMNDLYVQFNDTNHKAGYALVMLDLPLTIQNLYKNNQDKRANRMMALCQQTSWIFENE